MEILDRAALKAAIKKTMELPEEKLPAEVYEDALSIASRDGDRKVAQTILVGQATRISIKKLEYAATDAAGNGHLQIFLDILAAMETIHMEPLREKAQLCRDDLRRARRWRVEEKKESAALKAAEEAVLSMETSIIAIVDNALEAAAREGCVEIVEHILLRCSPSTEGMVAAYSEAIQYARYPAMERFHQEGIRPPDDQMETYLTIGKDYRMIGYLVAATKYRGGDLQRWLQFVIRGKPIQGYDVWALTKIFLAAGAKLEAEELRIARYYGHEALLQFHEEQGKPQPEPPGRLSRRLSCPTRPSLDEVREILREDPKELRYDACNAYRIAYISDMTDVRAVLDAAATEEDRRELDARRPDWAGLRLRGMSVTDDQWDRWADAASHWAIDTLLEEAARIADVERVRALIGRASPTGIDNAYYSCVRIARERWGVPWRQCAEILSPRVSADGRGSALCAATQEGDAEVCEHVRGSGVVPQWATDAISRWRAERAQAR